MSSIGRLIPLAARGPIENMSIDQALLESTGDRQTPTLRFYCWDRPTLSLGYFQKLGDRNGHPESASIDCVRRSTGGGAIVHHHELTYSLFLPITEMAGPQLDLYEQVHGEFVNLLRDVGVMASPVRVLAPSIDSPPSEPFLCFQRRTAEDLIVSGYKVLGSAQRKVRGAVLQHGSLLLRSSQWAPQLPGIGELTGRFLAADEVAESLSGRLGKRLSIAWKEDSVSHNEARAAEEIAAKKFGSEQWHHRR